MHTYLYIYMNMTNNMKNSFALLHSIPGNLYDQYAEFANQYAQYDLYEPPVIYKTTMHSPFC